MVSNNENLNSKIVRITKEMLKKEEGDFYEMVHIALEDPENVIEILDDTELYLQLSKEINSETPDWQAEIFSHPYMPQIALAALYHELIDIDDFSFLETWFNAKVVYGVCNAKIVRLSEQLGGENVLHHYVNKQHKYSDQYAKEFHNIKKIYKKIENEIYKTTRKNKNFAICIDITDGFEDEILFFEIEKTGLMDFTHENGSKFFIYPHPVFAKAVHKLIFDKEAVYSAARFGQFDADLIRKYQKLNIRLADLWFNKIKSLKYAHKSELNAIKALIHDLFHQIAASVVPSGLRNVIDKRILPIILNLRKKFGETDFLFDIRYDQLVDLNFTAFRHFDISRQELIRTTLSEYFFDGDGIGTAAKFDLSLYVTYDMAVYSPQWEKEIPELNVKKLHFDGFFKFFPDLIKKIKFFHEKSKKMVFIGVNADSNRKDYIILKALIDYFDNNLNKFDPYCLRDYVEYFLVPACLAVQQSFSELSLARKLSNILKDIDQTENIDNNSEQIKNMLFEFKACVENFELSRENAYEISKNSSSFFNGFKLFRQDVAISQPKEISPNI